MNKKFKIDFIGVGFPRCGSTWLAYCLEEHPEISFSAHKETNYFLPRDMNLKRPSNKFFFKSVRTKTWQDYQNEFPEKDKIKGEFSVHYIYFDKSLNKIKRIFPEVKILVVIRNPVEFLHSAYLFNKYSNAGHLFPDNFQQGVKEALEEDLHHIEKARFAKYLKKCFQIFGKNHVKAILLDDIKTRPQQVLKDLYGWLEVNEDFIPEKLQQKINVLREPRFSKFSKLIFNFVKIYQKIKGEDNSFYNLVNKENIGFKFYKKVLMKKTSKGKINPKFKKDLMKKLRPEVKELEKLLDRNLNFWK